MNKLFKYFYIGITFIFVILTLYEFFVYMGFESNYYGLFYLIINIFIIFLLFNSAYNYKKANKKIRISKNIICVVLGLVSSFLLSSMLGNIFSYTDSSSLFINKVYISSKIMKPIIYGLLILVSFLEIYGDKLINTIKK